MYMKKGSKEGVRIGVININDMYNNDVGKGGVYAYEAYEVKWRVALVRVPFYFINLLPTSLLYISILLTRNIIPRPTGLLPAASAVHTMCAVL